MTFFDRMYLPAVPMGEEYPVFRRISIESSSRCNRKCSFCPVATGRREFPNELMEWDTFFAIAQQLHELGWNEFIQLFLLNEPLLNKRLEREGRLLRKACPKSTIYISSNGDVLDKMPIERALATLENVYESGINSINLNIYDDEAQAERYHALAAEAVARIGVTLHKHKYRKVSPRKRWLAITDMRIDSQGNQTSSTDKLYNRTDEDRTDTFAAQNYCSRAQNHLVIDWKGRVPICCGTDVSQPESGFVGDVSKQTLLGIWNNEMFFKYRWFTQQKARLLPDCSTCEHRPAYAHVVRKVTAEDRLLEEWREGAREHLKERGIDPSQFDVLRS